MFNQRLVRLRPIGCHASSHTFAALRRKSSISIECRASQQIITGNGTTVAAAEMPARFAGSALDVQTANLNACVEFLKEELPRIFETGVRRLYLIICTA